MMHKNRRWCVANVDSAEELADKLANYSWCCCCGFELDGILWLNDATGVDGAQEYAVADRRRSRIHTIGKWNPLLPPGAASGNYWLESRQSMAMTRSPHCHLAQSSSARRNTICWQPWDQKNAPRGRSCILQLRPRKNTDAVTTARDAQVAPLAMSGVFCLQVRHGLHVRTALMLQLTNATFQDLLKRWTQPFRQLLPELTQHIPGGSIGYTKCSLQFDGLEFTSGFCQQPNCIKPF